MSNERTFNTPFMRRVATLVERALKKPAHERDDYIEEIKRAEGRFIATTVKSRLVTLAREAASPPPQEPSSATAGDDDSSSDGGDGGD